MSLFIHVAGFVRIRDTFAVDARSAEKFTASFCSVRTKCFISLYHSTQALDYFLFCVHQLTKFFWQLYKLCAAADVWHYVRQFYQRYGIISTSQRESLSSGVAAAECCQSGSRHGRGTEYGSASRCIFMQMSGTTFLLFCMRTHPVCCYRMEDCMTGCIFACTTPSRNWRVCRKEVTGCIPHTQKSAVKCELWPIYSVYHCQNLENRRTHFAQKLNWSC